MTSILINSFVNLISQLNLHYQVNKITGGTCKQLCMYRQLYTISTHKHIIPFTVNIYVNTLFQIFLDTLP